MLQVSGKGAGRKWRCVEQKWILVFSTCPPFPIFNSFSQVLYIVCSLKWLPACRSCVQMYPVQCPVSPLWPNSSSEWNRASCQVSLPPLRICGRHFQLPIYNGLWSRNICTQMIDKTEQYHHFKASVPLVAKFFIWIEGHISRHPALFHLWHYFIMFCCRFFVNMH